MTKKLAWVGLASCLVLACSGTTIGVDGGDEAGAGDGAIGEGGADTGTDGTSGNCNAPPINLTFANCPAGPTCGGTIASGTYYYTAGCIPDPWLQAKNLCPALTVHNEKGTVKACLTFTGGSVARDVQSSYSATLDIPQGCLFNATCAQLENNIKQYFTTASCAAAVSGCTCTVSSSYAATGGSTYTTTNNQIVTGAGNHYNYCVAGNAMDAEWASGPNREPGVYTLGKQ